MKKAFAKGLKKVGNLEERDFELLWISLLWILLEPDALSEMIVEILLARLPGCVHPHLQHPSD